MILRTFQFQYLFYIFIIVFAVNNFHLKAQTIKDISVISDKRISESEINERLKIFINKEFDSLKFSISTEIENYLTEFGFLRGVADSFNVTTIDSNNISVKIIIKENKQFIIKKISISNDSLTGFEAAQLNNRFINLIVNDNSIKNIAQYILNQFDKDGFIFAEVKFDSLGIIDFNDNEYFSMLSFSLNKNLQAEIKKTVIEGNTNTDEIVILREGIIGKGDLFTDLYAERVQKRLRKTNIFGLVELPEFYFNSSNEGILKIKVSEGNTNSFDGIIGYLPSSDINKDGYFTGLVNVSLRNLFGTYRAFSLLWQKIDRSSQELEVRFFEPYIFGLPLNITPQFYQKQQDSTYIDRNIILNSEIILSEYFALSFSFSNQRIIPTSENIPGKPTNSSSILTGLGFRYDTKDDIFLATEGIYFRTDYSLKSKKIYEQNAEKYNLQKINLDFEFYYTIFYHYTFFISFHGKQITGDNIELSDMFRIGGLNTLRGYNENQFIGSKTAYSNLEFRISISGKNVIYPFCDIGFYQMENSSASVSMIKIGYGIGMVFETPVGLLRVNYGLNNESSLTKGKIHFGIINAF